jgi:G3E family GTPase
MIKIYVLTGFLGSGKTTLLNSFLKQLSRFKNVVIENEFGNANVDAHLVDKKYDRLFELTNGCLCCSLDQELWDVLFQLIKTSTKPDHLFIETSGVANPLVVLDLLSNPKIKEFFFVEHVISVVDLENYEQRNKQTLEFGKQIASATTIIINKSEKCEQIKKQEAYNFIRKVQPYAQLLFSNNGEVNWNELKSNTHLYSHELVSSINNEHTSGLNNVSISLPNNCDIKKVLSILKMILQLYSHQVFRIKGIIKDLSGKFYSVNSTGLYIETNEIEQLFDFVGNQLVFIGIGLKKESMLRFFIGLNS